MELSGMSRTTATERPQPYSQLRDRRGHGGHGLSSPNAWHFFSNPAANDTHYGTIMTMHEDSSEDPESKANALHTSESLSHHDCWFGQVRSKGFFFRRHRRDRVH